MQLPFQLKRYKPNVELSMLKLLLLTTLLSLTGNGYAQSQLPRNVRPPLTKEFPDSKIIKGDLNGDGLVDFAILTSGKTTDGATNRVAIYVNKPDGSYAFAAQSGNLDYGTIDIALKRKSLYILAIHNSLKESFNEVYQFTFHNDAFLLVGKQENAYSPDDGSEYTLSENYLTGKRIEKRKINNKTKETSSLLSTRELKSIRLDQFSR
jgi:hypothetical protein